MATTSYFDIDTDITSEQNSTSSSTTAMSTNASDLTEVPYYHRLVISAIFVLITVVGCPGNMLVIVSVSLSKKLQTATNVLVVSLAVADLLQCCMLPLQMAMLLSNRRSWALPLPACIAVVAISYTSICCSNLTLANIAMVRWYVITKSIHGNHGLNTHRTIFAIAIATWVVSAMLMIAPPTNGIGTLGISEYYHMCLVTDDNPMEIYFVFLQAVVMIIGLLATATFYLLILHFVLQNSKRFKAQFGDCSADVAQASDSDKGEKKASQSTFNKRDVDITKNLFLVVCVFVVCIIPNFVSFVIPGSSVLTMYTCSITVANSSMNPIIYGLKHPNFKEVFPCVLGGNLAAVPQPSRLLKRYIDTKKLNYANNQKTANFATIATISKAPIPKNQETTETPPTKITQQSPRPEEISLSVWNVSERLN